MIEISFDPLPQSEDWEFQLKDPRFKIIGAIDSMLLEDEVGDNSSQESRRNYLLENQEAIASLAISLGADQTSNPLSEILRSHKLYSDFTPSNLNGKIRVRSVDG